MKHWAILSIAIVALLAPGCALLPKETEAPPIELVAPVTTQREIVAARRGPIDSRLSLAVSVGATQQQSLYLRTGGRLKHLNAQVGAHVDAGELLVELESGTQPYDVEQAKLGLDRARLTLEAGRARRGFVDAPTALDLQKAELDVQQAQLALQQKQGALADLQLTAPFAGTVISLGLAEGDQADAYKEVLVLAADGPTAVRARVDDAAAAQLQVGQAVDILPQDGDPTPIRGKVTETPPAALTQAQRSVVITPDQPSPRLTAGRNGRAEVIVQSKQDALLVPVSAVRTFGGRQFVTIVSGDDARQEVAVKIGLQNDAYVEVLEGLKVGDRVVGR